MGVGGLELCIIEANEGIKSAGQGLVVGMASAQRLGGVICSQFPFRGFQAIV